MLAIVTPVAFVRFNAYFLKPLTVLGTPVSCLSLVAESAGNLFVGAVSDNSSLCVGLLTVNSPNGLTLQERFDLFEIVPYRLNTLEKLGLLTLVEV